MTLLLALILAASPVFQMSQADVDAFLKNLHAQRADYGSRVITVARQTLGTPYVNGPLGEGPEGEFDKDPLIDLTRVDCVTFIEQTLALAASASYQQAFDLLQRIRYRDGKIDYATRNHFMEADWVANNHFCRDISGSLNVPLVSVTRTISRKTFFEKNNAPDLGRDIRDQPMTLACVPVAEAAKAEKALPSPCMILFIGKIDWLFALHCALYIREEDGEGRLYHASSTEKKVTTMPFMEPFEKSTRYLGFTAYALDNPAAPAGKP